MHTWRELLLEPYRLIYRIAGDTVTVLALFDGRRELEDLLGLRLRGSDRSLALSGAPWYQPVR